MSGLPAEVEMTHATRTDYLASVMLDGLKTDSDGRLWCHMKKCAEDASHYRGGTPLDAFSSCIITLQAAAENLEIDAEDIGGDGERVVVRGPSESAEISARVCSVTFRIPSPEFDRWRESLRTCLDSCIDYHGNEHLTKCTMNKAKRQLWMLLAHRLCYDRDTAWETGKYSRVKKIAHLMHIEVFEALRPFWWLADEESKKKAWRARVWQHLPLPFQEWFQKEYTAAAAEFIDQPAFDTRFLYRVTGDVAKQPDFLPGETPGPSRTYAVEIVRAGDARGRRFLRY